MKCAVPTMALVCGQGSSQATCTGKVNLLVPVINNNTVCGASELVLMDQTEFTALNASIAAAASSSGGPGGTVTGVVTLDNPLFNIDNESAVVIGGAIWMLWAVAWLFRMLRKSLESSRESD